MRLKAAVGTLVETVGTAAFIFKSKSNFFNGAKLTWN